MRGGREGSRTPTQTLSPARGKDVPCEATSALSWASSSAPTRRLRASRCRGEIGERNSPCMLAAAFHLPFRSRSRLERSLKFLKGIQPRGRCATGHGGGIDTEAWGLLALAPIVLLPRRGWGVGGFPDTESTTPARPRTDSRKSRLTSTSAQRTSFDRGRAVHPESLVALVSGPMAAAVGPVLSVPAARLVVSVATSFP